METHNQNEKEGVIPVTIGLINSCRKKDDKLEYQGVLLHEIVIVGILVKYEDLDTKTVVGIWDQTGFRDVLFYNRSESEAHSGLAGFTFTADKMPVKLFCKVKYYKEDIRLDGAKILKVDMNEFIYHKIVVLNDWKYLVGRHNDEGINTTTIKEKNNFNNSEEGDYGKVFAAIKKLESTKGSVSIEHLMSATDINKNSLNNIIQKLLNDCKIIESSNGYYNLI